MLRDDDEMPVAPRDHAEAARADVVLHRLVGLHSLGVDVVVCQATSLMRSEECPDDQGQTRDEREGDHRVLEDAGRTSGR